MLRKKSDCEIPEYDPLYTKKDFQLKRLLYNQININQKRNLCLHILYANFINILQADFSNYVVCIKEKSWS